MGLPSTPFTRYTNGDDVEAEFDKGFLMASPGELVRAVAEVLGLPEATVTVHDRNLVTAGLRTKGGRGTSAAKMTPRDAAHLLVAVMGSAQVKDSVLAVRRYAESRPHKHTSSEHGFANVAISELAGLPANHSFIDALEALITSAANGSLPKAMYDDIAEFEGEKIGYAPIIEVAVQTPSTVGDIRIAGSKRGMIASVRYALPNPWSLHNSIHPPKEEVQAWEAKAKEYHSEADLEQYRRISAKTILRIGKTLSF